MEKAEKPSERSSQDRRSGTDRRLENSVIECLDHFGITLSRQGMHTQGTDDRRKDERRRCERRGVFD